jgi:IclR family pca regulon transcriptional regulator
VSTEERAEYVRSLERGLSVLQAFSGERPAMTLADVARSADLTRATARRLLLTLVELGYLQQDGREFRLTPKVLNIGYAYLSSLDLARLAQPSMEALAEQTHESCSAAVLDGAEIVYVARVPAKRILTISIGLGSRLPAHATSMGRVLLADLPPEQLDRLLAERPLEALTPMTVTDTGAIKKELQRVRQQGWALVDQELELGLRSIAAPLRNRPGCAVAALNVSTHASRVDMERLLGEFLPALLRTAARVTEGLAGRF